MKVALNSLWARVAAKRPGQELTNTNNSYQSSSRDSGDFFTCNSKMTDKKTSEPLMIVARMLSILR